MDDQQIEAKLMELAVGICDKLVDIEIKPEVELTKQGMDSLDVLDYVLGVEGEFGLNIDNDQFDELSLGAIRNMVKYISSK
jgi:acyl carrier protein